MSDRHIRRSGADYAHALAALLPRGAAWPREPSSLVMQVVRALAQIWGSPNVSTDSDVAGTTQIVESRAGDLLERESDPRSTIELLPDWERNWGLPDPCFDTPQTIGARQRFLVQRMTMIGGVSRAFFQQISAEIGYPISIREFSPFMCGVSRVGNTTREPGADGVHYRWEIGPPEMRFYWTSALAAASLDWFRCGNGGGQCGINPHLTIGTPPDSQCLIDRWKPAHTQIVYDFSNLQNVSSMAGTP